jgi:hypothetical protein
MPSAYRELSYPLPIKGGDILRTLQDARTYMLMLGPHRELRNHWQYARQLLRRAWPHMPRFSLRAACLR